MPVPVLAQSAVQMEGCECIVGPLLPSQGLQMQQGSVKFLVADFLGHIRPRIGHEEFYRPLQDAGFEIRGRFFPRRHPSSGPLFLCGEVLSTTAVDQPAGAR